MSFVKWLSGSTVVEALQIARLSYRGSAQRRKLLSLRSKFRIVQSHNLPLRKTYFFTSEKGIYLLERNTIIQVTDLPTYGLAIAGDVCYLGAYLQDKNTTILCRGRCEALFHDDTSFEFEIIYKSVVDSSNHRIHQVTTGQSSIWCALTGNNTLLEVDVSSGQILNEYAVFLDQYGWPVTGTDHNHVYSVHAYGNYLLYTLYRVGNQSLVALCHDGEVIGYAYPNTGVHDIYLYTDGFIISDTFGDKTREGGFPVTVDSLFDESFLISYPDMWFADWLDTATYQHF